MIPVIATQNINSPAQVVQNTRNTLGDSLMGPSVSTAIGWKM